MTAQIPHQPPNDHHTYEQWKAIYQSGSNILVAASAGSGKTTVLVQRIIEKIKSGTNVDELLVVTFTESAAKEMKDRIRVAIQDAISSSVNEEQYYHLLRQNTLLAQASISTIHAFCLKVIQRFFYLLDIDPVFRMMGDAIEIEMLKEDVWEEVKENLYGEPGTFFKPLAKAYSSERNDDGLRDLIFKLYDFSRANPDPEKWLDEMVNLYQKEGAFEESKLYQELIKPQVLRELEGILDEQYRAKRILEQTQAVKNFDTVQSELASTEQVYHAIQQDDYQTAYETMLTLSFVRWTSASKKNEHEIDDINFAKTIRDQYKKSLQTLQKNYFMRDRSEQVWVLEETVPYVEEMRRVTNRFTEAYWERKKRDRILDFNDLEHLTLALLRDQEGKPSEASRYYREKFEEVLIDEYQDVNKLQELILYGVTRHEVGSENLFMVGDVKQSIYAFRLADPSLFLSKYEAFGKSEGGERIILADNFRSRGEVLSFTNFVFTQLMDREVGQMEYDELAELKQGNRSFPESTDFETEVLLYVQEGPPEESVPESESNEVDEWQIDSKAMGEATIVAQKMKQLIENQTQIYDKKSKSMRSLQYKDIVLLTPTKKNNLLLQETFKEHEIPLILNDSQSFFQRTEISVMLSLLQIIDNPRQDIPLAAVLRSPIVGLNEQQLAIIRVGSKQTDFYEAVQTLLRKDENVSPEEHVIQKTVAPFFEKITHWRHVARQESLVSLIWDIYEETRFLDYVGGMPAGRQRVANLHALYERAKTYERTQFKGLFQFVRFISRIQERDQDLAEPTTFHDEEDAVRLMTIHASKGLEFPVVFVMDQSKSFNLQDVRGKYLFSEEYGIGTDLFDVPSRLRYPSLATVALAYEKKKQLLAEEMRKLYVALTRAEQKLYLVGTYRSDEDAWTQWSAADGVDRRVLTDYLRLNASNAMKWIGYTLYRHDLLEVNNLQKTYRGELTNYPVRFSVSFYGDVELVGQIATIHLEEEPVEDLIGKWSKESYTGEEQAFQKAVERMEATYPHETATQTTSYQSVSEIKRLFEDPDQAKMLHLEVGNREMVSRYVEPELPRPMFLQEVRKPTSAEVGTAVHHVMQQIPLTEPITDSMIKQIINQYVEAGRFSPLVAEQIDPTMILRFFDTALGQMMIQFNDRVHREVPFTMLMNAHNLYQGVLESDDDHLLIHGIIDGFIELDDAIILFDFKTDHVGNRLDFLVQKYRGQLTVYNEAIATSKNKPVQQAYLVFLTSGDIIEVT